LVEGVSWISAEVEEKNDDTVAERERPVCDWPAETKADAAAGAWDVEREAAERESAEAAGRVDARTCAFAGGFEE
jgi:hypothetical protein